MSSRMEDDSDREPLCPKCLEFPGMFEECPDCGGTGQSDSGGDCASCHGNGGLYVCTGGCDSQETGRYSTAGGNDPFEVS